MYAQDFPAAFYSSDILKNLPLAPFSLGGAKKVEVFVWLDPFLGHFILIPPCPQHSQLLALNNILLDCL